MKAIVIGPEHNGDGVYYLIAEDGDVLCSHMCSSIGYAASDLYADRPERKAMFDKKGITEFVRLEESGLTREELKKRNHEYFEAHKNDPKKDIEN